MKVNLISCLTAATVITLTACAPLANGHNADPQAAAAQKDVAPSIKIIELDTALDAQSDEAKARYQYRHPKETLDFFAIKPGMNVAEALPGGGWYTKILLPYLGAEGSLVGVDYAYDLYPNFSFVNDEFLEKKKTWVETWTNDAQPWRGDNGAQVSATTFGTIPTDLNGTMDAVLFFRALHNLARFQDKGEYLSKAIADSLTLLKPGGMVGVVQHEAREDRDDEWANGDNGYLKKSFIISQFEAAGFELVAESDINSNDKDQANVGDIVWRLPPSLATSKEDEELKSKMLEIGESNRMTLKFRKPIDSSS